MNDSAKRTVAPSELRRVALFAPSNCTGNSGAAPSPEALDEASRLYQQSIRNSPLWDEMVKQFGEEEAERLLLKRRVEAR